MGTLTVNSSNFYNENTLSVTVPESPVRMRWVKDTDQVIPGIIVKFDPDRGLVHGKFDFFTYTKKPDVYSFGKITTFFEMKASFKHGLLISFSNVSIEDYFDHLQTIDFDTFVVGDQSGGYERVVFPAKLSKNVPFRFGVTAHPTRGTWSSYPVHEFEQRHLLAPTEIEFHEKFAYMTSPAGGWGIQTIVGRNNKQVIPFKDRDILDIPLSNHPVVAGPDYYLSYVWAYTPNFEKFNEHGRI